MTIQEFSIARDFTRFPGPRFKHQGAFSGEALSKKLAKLLRNDPSSYRINLDGTTGIGSSFLDQAFGGLVSDHGFSPSELERRLSFVSEIDPSYEITIRNAISKAARQATFH